MPVWTMQENFTVICGGSGPKHSALLDTVFLFDWRYGRVVMDFCLMLMPKIYTHIGAVAQACEVPF